MNRNQNESKEQKNFGQVTGLAVAIIFGLLLPWLFDKDYLWWPWCIALVLWGFSRIHIPWLCGQFPKHG